MQIKFVEIQNFRKLKSVRIELAKQTTLLVGANNSGKTSAMVALGYFLVDPKRFTANDITLSNWSAINKIADGWESSGASPDNSLKDWADILPTLDLWLEVDKNEVHHVCHIIPTLSWNPKDLLGIRLRLEPKDIGELRKEYTTSLKAAKGVIEEVNKNPEKKCKLALWPKTMQDFLDKKLANQFDVRFYLLDPKKISDPQNGIANPQK